MINIFRVEFEIEIDFDNWKRIVLTFLSINDEKRETHEREPSRSFILIKNSLVRLVSVHLFTSFFIKWNNYVQEIWEKYKKAELTASSKWSENVSTHSLCKLQTSMKSIFIMSARMKRRREGKWRKMRKQQTHEIFEMRISTDFSLKITSRYSQMKF